MTEDKATKKVKTKRVKGKNLLGEPREYEFNLLNARNGGRIVHEYTALFLSLTANLKSGEMSQVEIISTLPHLLPYEKLELLAKMICAGATAKVDGREYLLDEDGEADYMTGNPLEFETALFYGIQANYGKHIASFFAAAGDDDGSTPDTPISKIVKMITTTQESSTASTEERSKSSQSQDGGDSTQT